jgi:hypothetical protein
VFERHEEGGGGDGRLRGGGREARVGAQQAVEVGDAFKATTGVDTARLEDPVGHA